jgi:tetratricopeptide (TPR) repeat protein
MSSNIPTTRQLSLPFLVPQLIIIGLIIYLYHLADFTEPFILGAITYSLLALTLRNLIAKNHRKGIQLVKEKKFSDAIPYFEKSVAYFSQHSWVDKYRFLTLLSSSGLTYKEMGLCNIAFAYGQTGNGQRATEYYEQVLAEFPENGLAIAALNMIKSVENKLSDSA